MKKKKPKNLYTQLVMQIIRSPISASVTNLSLKVDPPLHFTLENIKNQFFDLMFINLSSKLRKTLIDKIISGTEYE